MDLSVSLAQPLRARALGDRALLVASGTASALLVGVAVGLGASARTGDPAMSALVRGVMVGVPLAAAIAGWQLRIHVRFARLLAVLGVVTLATTLAESSDPALYTAGRIAGWLLEALLVVLLLVYPSDRLSERVDRGLVAATGAVLAVFLVPTILLADHFAVPSPYTSCTASCPPNALFLLDRQPSFVDPALRMPGSLLVFALMLAVLLRLQQKMRSATPAGRRLLGAVVVVGMVHVAAIALAVLGRELGNGETVIVAGTWLIALSIPAIAVAFMVGLVQLRLFDERALRRLAIRVRSVHDLPALRRAFAEAFDDPLADIVFPTWGAPDEWRDCTGETVELPQAGDDRSVTLVRGDDTVIAALVCDVALSARPEFVDAAGALAAIALDQQRLATEAEVADHEVRSSRARIVASVDEERRRIERDLHDGAQQRLVALRIEMGLLEDLAESHPEQCAERIHELGDVIDEALDELRSLAHGVRPPLLADRGLADALRAAATRCTVPVELRIADVGRYPPELESAVYFCVLEALQNVAKHARGARRAVLTLNGEGADLRFDVRDDGCGSDPATTAAGVGITNMQDRVAALGGRLDVVSTSGLGTEVRGRIPIQDLAGRLR